MPVLSPDAKTTLLLLLALAVAFSVFSIVGDLAKLPFTQAYIEIAISGEEVLLAVRSAGAHKQADRTR